MLNLTERVEVDSEKSPGEFLEGLRSKGSLSRADLLTYSGEIFRIAFLKLYGKSTSAPDKLSWARVVTSCITAVGPILKDTELDELRADVESIKARLGKV